jgi:hypothetical protein
MELPVKKIAAAGLLATAVFTVAMIVHLSGQQASNVSGDFRNASTAEVRDAAGQVLLRGTFAQVAGDEDEIERKAALTATAAGGQASGDAEVEYREDEPNIQEIEFQVSGVPPRAVLTLNLDGTDIISATANDKGRAEAEVNVAVTPRH